MIEISRTYMPSVCKGKMESQKERKQNLVSSFFFLGLRKPWDEKVKCLELQSVTGHLVHA